MSTATQIISESLQDKRHQGKYRKATSAYIELLLETIEKAPEELGYEFGRWTGERLATYLALKTGIKLSASQIRKILKRKKYVYLWAKYSLEAKQNPEERAEFSQKLREYLAIAKSKPELLQVWFWDESGFSLRVIRRSCMGKKRKAKAPDRATTKGTSQRHMGGLRYSDRKRVCYFVKKGNADSFYEQLYYFNEFVKQEWIAKGNRAEDFPKLGPKIVIILDNASYHKRTDIRAEIAKNLPNIILEFLPPYSPDFNLIELVWHSCKEYLAHRLFQSISELESLLKKLLNEGELVIKWERQLKNKGNAVSAS